MEKKHSAIWKMKVIILSGSFLKLFPALKQKFLRMQPTQTIVLVFLALILTGAFLLMLPISSKSNTVTPFIDTLFTATSATCITGLVVYDTFVHWSIFGQLVILSLIQIGGLGFMTIATLISFLLRRRITLRERLLIVESLNQTDIQGVVLLAKRVLFATFTLEILGAIVLSMRFVGQYGIAGGIYRGIFTAVSAFCNAGFDLLGDQGEFCSLTNYVGDYLVNIPIIFLIVTGGLGFYVWIDLYKARRFRDFRLHTVLVLGITFILILGGSFFIFLFEHDNPKTLASLPLDQKLLASLFQAVTTRTAGFDAIAQGNMTELSKVTSTILMFIGGSPGSTAGGVKTVTMGVLLLSVWSTLRGRRDTTVWGKRIGQATVLRATAVVILGLTMTTAAAMIISYLEDLPFLSCLFETVSAFGTVGLTLGITPDLNSASKLILIFLMYLGRVGILTMTYALAIKMDDKTKIRYPEAKVMIG